MRFFESKLNITNDGVYRPMRPWVSAIGCALIFLLLARQLYLERIPIYAAFLFSLLTVSIPIITRIKYGKLGMPYVTKSSSMLMIYLPGDSRGKIRFDLAGLREIQIYGRLSRRKYRFIRQDGTFVDLTPYFGEKLDQAVIQYLLTNCPPHVEVKICEPQSFFEEIRGDGP